MKEERVLFPSEALELNIITQIKKTDMAEKKDETKERRKRFIKTTKESRKRIIRTTKERRKRIIKTTKGRKK